MPTYTAKHNLIIGSKSYSAGEEVELTLKQAEEVASAVVIKKMLEKPKAKKDK